MPTYCDSHVTSCTGTHTWTALPTFRCCITRVPDWCYWPSVVATALIWPSFFLCCLWSFLSEAREIFLSKEIWLALSQLNEILTVTKTAPLSNLNKFCLKSILEEREIWLSITLTADRLSSFYKEMNYISRIQTPKIIYLLGEKKDWWNHKDKKCHRWIMQNNCLCSVHVNVLVKF